MTQFPKDQTFLKLIEATKINHSAEMQKLVTKLLQPPVETLEIIKNQRLARAQLFEPYQRFEELLKERAESPKTLEALFRPLKDSDLSAFCKVNDNIFKTTLSKMALPDFEELTKTAKAFHTSWVNIDNPLLSIKAIADLSTIGKALSIAQPFDPKLVSGLRDSLGDWRIKSKLDPSQILDLDIRTKLYETKGFDNTLTSFPLNAFNEAVVLTGVKPSSQEIPLQEIKDSGIILPSPENMEAYQFIYQLEVTIRLFITQHMEHRFGTKWLEQQIPADTLKTWEDKKQKALEKGQPDRHLIEYSDFTDYEKIFTRKNNWNEVFKPFFKRKESLQESFYRLGPVRICTMHSRIITEGDLLMLYVEFQRLMRAMGVVEISQV